MAGQVEETKSDDRWYCKSDVGYLPLPVDVSRATNLAPIKEPVNFSINESSNREHTYVIIRVTERCAWQRNVITNRVRPVIRNYNAVEGDKDILNQKEAINPFAASKVDQTSFMKQSHQRFAEILPGQ